MLIEVFSDVVCPWCYVGERRLSRALEQRPDLDVEVRWRPFQLRPELPAEGMPWDEMVREKFGGWERARRMFEHVRQVGEGEGITLDFERVANSPNTTDAHRLILLAREQEKEWEMANALFAAYFTEGRSLSDPDELVRIATGVGLESADVRDFLASDEKVAEVVASQRDAYQSGIHSVPSYVINERYLVQGAQETPVFLQVLDTVEERERSERSVVG